MGLLQTAAEPESGVWVYWGVLSGDSSLRMSGRQDRQRERLICDVISTEASADLQQLGAQVALQSCAKPREGGRPLFLCIS